MRPSQKSIPFFEQAIDKDPNFALAYSGLADSYALLTAYSVEPPRQLMPKAKRIGVLYCPAEVNSVYNKKQVAAAAEKLGFEVATDYRQNDDNWWVTLTLPGGASITLARASTTSHEAPKSGSLGLYFSTSDIAAAHKELNERGVRTGEIRDNLYGPGSGVKFFQLQDPDGNQVTFAQE